MLFFKQESWYKLCLFFQLHSLTYIHHPSVLCIKPTFKLQAHSDIRWTIQLYWEYEEADIGVIRILKVAKEKSAISSFLANTHEQWQLKNLITYIHSYYVQPCLAYCSTCLLFVVHTSCTISSTWYCKLCHAILHNMSDSLLWPSYTSYIHLYIKYMCFTPLLPSMFALTYLVHIACSCVAVIKLLLSLFIVLQ